MFGLGYPILMDIIALAIIVIFAKLMSKHGILKSLYKIFSLLVVVAAVGVFSEPTMNTMESIGLNKQIDETLRRYNAKITRLARQRSDYMLPQKVSKEDLMELSYTRSDLQRRLKALSKFNERGAEKTILTSRGYAI